MKFLKRLVGNKGNLNPLYIKLKGALSRQEHKLDIKNVYFLFGILYSIPNLAKVRKAISENTTDQVKKNEAYDVLKDNIELYLIEDTSAKYYLIVLLDPYELYEKETIIEMIPVNNIDFDMELIFPQ